MQRHLGLGTFSFMKMTRFLAFFLAIAVFSFVPYRVGAKVSSRQAAFYLTSTGNDSNPGTKALPWKTVKPLNNHKFAPGDTVFFARGSNFKGGFIITSSGKPGKPIVFTTYGKGPKPVFTNPGYDNLNGNAIQIKGSYIVIDGLYFYNCPKSPVCEDIRTLGAIFIAVGADHNVVRNCEMTKTPVGIQVYGQYNLITHNYIHDDNVPIRPHWGPICVVVCTPNNEVSYNRFENYSAPSNEYGHDGGAIEINDRDYPKENIEIHHNYSYRNQGFIEFVGLTKQNNMVIHHNVCEDYQSFIGFTGPCTNIRVENNTVVRVLAHRKPDSEDVTFWFYYTNSNITIRNNIFVYDPSRVEGIFSRGKFPHNYNLYYRIDNPKIFDQANYSAYMRLILGGGASLGEGDKIGDPLFVDFKNHDFHLKADSPAIDAGVDLGYKLDFDNNPIPSGATPDMGAYEYQSK